MCTKIHGITACNLCGSVRCGNLAVERRRSVRNDTDCLFALPQREDTSLPGPERCIWQSGSFSARSANPNLNIPKLVSQGCRFYCFLISLPSPETLPSALTVDMAQCTGELTCCIASRNSGLHNLLLETSLSRRTRIGLNASGERQA
jgi:hypothetical protein